MDITIVIPLYNRKDTIRITLDSIVNSSVKPRQIIIVDNGSTDGSYEYAQTLSKLHTTDIMVARENTAGAAAARNKGLSLCQTPWIYFFDSDDIFTGLPSSWDEEAQMVCIPTQMQTGKRLRTRDYKAVKTPHTHVLNAMLNTVSMIFRTDFLRHIGGWNERCRIWDDWELGIRALIHAHKVQWITDKAYHRIIATSDSITGSSYSSRVAQIVQTLTEALDDILLMPQSTEKRHTLLAFYLRCHIIVGQMLREGDAQSASLVQSFIDERLQVEQRYARIGKMMRTYTARRIPGAWRIALWVVNNN